MPVVVPMGVVVRVPVGVTVVVMVVFQHPGAHQVHGQAQHGGGDGLVIADGQWIDHALHRFHQHGDGHAHQQQCAGVAPQHLNFPGAEGKAPILGIAGGHAVGKDGQPQGEGVGAHVPAVGHQRHGVEDPAAGDFQHHHHQRQPHHPAGASLGHRVALGEGMDDLAVGGGGRRSFGRFHASSR